MSDDILARIAAIDAPDTDGGQDAGLTPDTAGVLSGDDGSGAAGESGGAGDPSADQTGEGQLLAGKYRTAQELETAYKEAERRMHEATQKAREHEQLLQAIAEQQYAQPTGPVLGEPQTMQDLESLSYERPDEAVRFAAEKAPHLMPTVIAHVRSYDPVQAERYSDWYHEVKMETRLAAERAPLQAMQARAAAEQAHSKLAAKPGFEVLREDIAAVIQENPWMFQNVSDPAQLERNIDNAYMIARGRNPEKVQAALQAVASAQSAGLAGAHVEGGTAGGLQDTPEEDPSKTIAASIFAQSKKMSW